MIGRAGGAALAVALVATGAAAAVDAASRPALPGSSLLQRAPTLDELTVRMNRATQQVAAYERVGRDMARWFDCVRPLPVDQVGDLRHRWGFAYDERDGTGIDLRPGLVIHRGSTPPDLLLLRFSRDHGCVSAAPDPNGTGADARATTRPLRQPRSGTQEEELQRLELRMDRLKGRIDEVDEQFGRFDEWESCLSWLPVTELGHEDQDLGYLFDPATRSGEPSHVAAVDIDSSEWDDPDYELLVFLGSDRPFTSVECGHDPGEGVDRGMPRVGSGADSVRDRIEDLRRDLDDADEDIEDLLEPVQEFVQFDECMYTVGMRSRGDRTAGYRYVAEDGTERHRAALSFDLRGLELPEMDVMAFSGEEPPQIECNEDAAGESTDE